VTDELRLVLVFLVCIVLAYSIGAEHGRAAAYKRSAEKNGGGEA